MQALERIQAPQIERPDEPIGAPRQDSAAQGFGPLPRWWAPRTRYVGTLDARWQQERCPCLPDDFDLRFYQCAHPDMITPEYLRGDERITLSGVLPEGPVTMWLPGRRILVGFERESGETDGGRLELDTVAIDLNRRPVSLVWRGAFQTRDPVAVLAVRMVELGRGVPEEDVTHVQ